MSKTQLKLAVELIYKNGQLWRIIKPDVGPVETLAESLAVVL